MATATDAWDLFFSACDIPSKVREKYAKRFVKERIQPYLLKELGKDELRELGIDAVGDQLAIIRYVKQCKGCPPEFVQVGKSRGTAEIGSSDEDEDEEEEQMEVDQKVVASKVVNKNYEAIRETTEKQKPKRNLFPASGGGGISSRVTSVGRVRDLDKPTTTISITGISAQSKMIRKAPTHIQIPQITSSESPIVSKMRSDQIPGGKTTIVASPQRVSTTSDVVPPEARRITTRDPEIFVRLNMPHERTATKLLSVPPPRRAVAYDTDLFLEAEDAETDELFDEEIRSRRSRVTLNERISASAKAVQKSGAGTGPLIVRPRLVEPTLATTSAVPRAAPRRRPLITVGGRVMNRTGRGATFATLGGGRRRSLAAQAIAQAVPTQRTNILNRISFAR